MTIFNKIKNLFKAKNESVAKVNKATKVVAKKSVRKTTKAKVLDFFKFVSTDKARYFINGVYHEGGAKIATDGRILVMAKSEYEQKFEGVILSKSLVPIEGQFPNYKSILPDFSKMKKAEFDFQKIKDSLKKNDRILKIFKKLSRNKIILHKLQNGTMVNNDYMQKILHFAECYSDCVLYVGKENTKMCALVSGDVGNPTAICLFMPCLQGENMTEIDDSLYLTGDFSELSETDIIKGCKKIDILQRQEYGTMTEKDIAFLKDVHDFMAIFRKEKVA